MVGNSAFLPLSDSTEIEIRNCALSLNVSTRRLELLFDLALPGNPSDEHKILLPLGHILPGSFTINRSHPTPLVHSIFFEATVAPQVWKKLKEIDQDDLKTRLYWTEHEQWMRQCEIVRDPLDPSFLQSDTRIIMKNAMLQTGAGSKARVITWSNQGRALESIPPPSQGRNRGGRSQI